MPEETAIEVRDLVFSYHRDTAFIDRLSLDLYPGETAALVGANGAGKTTLGKLLVGILKPCAGSYSLFGEDAAGLPLSRIGRMIGYSFQNPMQQLFALSVEEEIAFGLKYRGVSQDNISRVIESLLVLFEIEHLRHAFPLNLSWGEKKRVVLAACLALEPKYLVLDEPTTGMDDERIGILNGVLGRLRERGKGMLLISHNRDFVAANAQRVLRLEGGRITDDRRR